MRLNNADKISVFVRPKALNFLLAYWLFVPRCALSFLIAVLAPRLPENFTLNPLPCAFGFFMWCQAWWTESSSY